MEKHSQFDNSQLQSHYERVVAAMPNLPEELRPIAALMDAYSWFKIIGGEDSPVVNEAIRRLTAPSMRDSLRKWYKHFGSNINAAALEFHDFLEGTIGEKLPLS